MFKISRSVTINIFQLSKINIFRTKMNNFPIKNFARASVNRNVNKNIAQEIDKLSKDKNSNIFDLKNNKGNYEKENINSSSPFQFDQDSLESLENSELNPNPNPENENVNGKENSKSKKRSQSENDDQGEDLKEKVKDSNEYIYGRRACEAVLKSNKRKILDVYVLVNFRVSPPEMIKYLMELAMKQKHKVKFASKAKLDKVSIGKIHNGIVLKCSRKPYIECKKFSDLKPYMTKESGNVVFLLDKVADNHNVANVIRSCVFLGSEVIVFNRQDRPMLSNQMANISGGASEVIDILSIKFIKKFLLEAQKEKWVVISTHSDKDKDDDDGKRDIKKKKDDKDKNSSSSDEEEVVSKYDSVKCKTVSLYDLKVEPKSNIVVVLSSDPDSHATSCNYQVTIPPFNENKINKFPLNVIDNLNSGVTAGIILSHLLKNK